MILLTPRYRLLHPLGTGSMGTVYRAYDRLNGHDVALKQVHLSPELNPIEVEEELLLLAQEFRTLAGLRHPHIISVLDYGFDHERRPFYTMELLVGAQPIGEAGKHLSLPGKIELVIQALEALAYLHRRGILHHDLKPDNILVTNQHARLLDFGLAVAAQEQRDNDAFGTLQYLAPEVFNGKPYTIASDLYSMGVIAYELLIGQHPFVTQSTREFLHQVRHELPDLAALSETPALADVIGHMLAKAPAERPHSAQAAHTALRQALGLPDTIENVEIRDSYLQAAAFVGREAELAQLTGTFNAAHQGQGSSWLVGGEGGVGKSRFLDEVRARALVEGFNVLRGQAVESAGLPYQLWRDAVRQLVLATELSDLDASVLKELIPDIAIVLDRVVADAPVLAGKAGQQRLVLTIAELFARQVQPTLLIIEDLHWSIESLLPLQQLNRIVATHQLIVIGSYRSDEAPHLPIQLPGMNVLPLQRLNAAETAMLSASMLGAAGTDSSLIELLQRETEGNSFFLVEVVRALAEEAGNLAQIGAMSLPRSVIAGGVRQIVRRRLARLPDWVQPALRVAAVIGRQLDLALLDMIIPGFEADLWLSACAEAAIIDLVQERWRFAHDKLREGVLLELEPGQRQVLHQQVANAIVQIYAAELAPHYADLAFHYAQAHDDVGECRYAYLAGEQAATGFVNDQALSYLTRASELTPADDLAARYAILRVRENVYELQGQPDRQTVDLAALAVLAEALGDDARRVHVGLRQAHAAWSIGDNANAIAVAKEATLRAHSLDEKSLEAEGHYRWGRALRNWGDHTAAITHLEQARTLAKATGRASLETDSLIALGVVFDFRGDLAAAQVYFPEALSIQAAIGDRRGQAASHMNIGWGALGRGDLVVAQQHFERCLALCRAVGDTKLEANVLNNLANLTAHGHADWDLARSLYRQSVDLSREIGDHHTEVFALSDLGLLAYQLGDYATAQAWCDQALDVIAQIGRHRQQGFVFTTLGHLLFDTGQLALAAERYQQALAAYRMMDITSALYEPQAGMACIALADGQIAQALAELATVMEYLAAHVLGNVRGSITQSARIYFACFQVLHAAHDPQAWIYLKHAVDLVQGRAAEISDLQHRQLFLEHIRLHRTILVAWHAQPN